MEPDLRQSKTLLRKRILAQLAQLSTAARDAASARARVLLEKQPRWQAADSIMFFAPQSGELDIWPLLKSALASGKTVGLPRFEAPGGVYEAGRITDLAADLTPGRFGILEPSSTCSVLPLNRLGLIAAG